MSAPAQALAKLGLRRTEDCVFITTHFTMGIGRILLEAARQVRAEATR